MVSPASKKGFILIKVDVIVIYFILLIQVVEMTRMNLRKFSANQFFSLYRKFAIWPDQVNTTICKHNLIVSLNYITKLYYLSFWMNTFSLLQRV